MRRAGVAPGPNLQMDLNWIFDVLTSPWMACLSLPLVCYFCWHLARDYNNLAECVDAIGANDATIFIPDQHTITDDLTIPSNITLRIIQGGSISVNAGKTVTINGQIDAGGYQIFEGAGTVVVNTYPQQEAWWGNPQEWDFGPADLFAANVPAAHPDKAAHDALGLSHDSLEDVSIDDHHPQAHTLASHSTKAHAELSDAPANAHHPQSHTLVSHSTKPHSALTDVTANQHHAESHTLASHSTKAHSELSDAPANAHHPQLHASAHHSGGGDAVKLDDFATPDDNVDLNVSTSRHGLFPKLSGHEAECYAGDGAWLRLYDSTSIVIKILSKLSSNLRNQNNTEQYTNELIYTKIKETKMGEVTGVMKVEFQLKSSDAGEAVYAKIYKNGSPIGSEHYTLQATYQTYSDNLGPFASQDEIQIYGHMEEGGVRCYVRYMRFYYDRTINMLGACTLTNPLVITTQNPFAMQHQDP